MNSREFAIGWRNLTICLWVGLITGAAGIHARAQDELDLEATLEKPKSSSRSARGAATVGDQANSAENATPAAALPPARDVDFTAFDAKSPVRRLVLTLDKGWDGTQSLTIQVWFRGEQSGMAWAETPAVPGYCYVAQANFAGFYNLPDKPLVLTDNKISGSVFCNPPNNQRRTDRKEEGGTSYAITATVQGNIVSGTWAGSSGKGGVSGKILAESDMRLPANAIDPKTNYPCWRNTGNGVGYETGRKLVEDLSQARIAWKGEDLIPPPYHEGINFGSVPVAIQSGHASLILLDGRLYIHYFTGSPGTQNPADIKGVDEVWDEQKGGILKRGYVPREMALKKYNRGKADQIVLCLDAQTGQTLWKTVFAGDGPNICAAGGAGISRHKLFGPSNKAASHLTPCGGDGPSTGSGQGKVFAKGTGGNLYCLDAVTGAVLWKHAVVTNKSVSENSLCDAPIYADGVVATVAEGGLTGYSAADGGKLWTVPNMGAGRGPCTIRWVHEGRNYFITPVGHLIEPKTGKVLWKTDPPLSDPAHQAVIAAGEGYLASGQGGKDGAKYLVFRITPQKAELAWSTDKYIAWRTIHAVIYRGHLWARAVTPERAAGSAARTYCFELATGNMVAEARGSKSFASVGAGDGFLFNSNAAVVLMQKADPKDFREIVPSKGGPSQCVADEQMPVILQNSPETSAIYADGRLFTRTFDGIVCYDLRDGPVK